jgi:hypothetical protein
VFDSKNSDQEKVNARYDNENTDDQYEKVTQKILEIAKSSTSASNGSVYSREALYERLKR